MYGRTDKKFCTDACRNVWNNKHRVVISPAVRFINRVLRRNHDILALFFHGDCTTAKARKAQLSALGFNFRYCTAVSRKKNGNTLYYCYEFSYCRLEGDWYCIKRSGPLAD